MLTASKIQGVESKLAELLLVPGEESQHSHLPPRLDGSQLSQEAVQAPLQTPSFRPQEGRGQGEGCPRLVCQLSLPVFP